MAKIYFMEKSSNEKATSRYHGKHSIDVKLWMFQRFSTLLGQTWDLCTFYKQEN